MTSRSIPPSARRWQQGAVACAVVAVLALVGLLGWYASGPDPTAGAGLSALTDAPSTPRPTPTPSLRASVSDSGKDQAQEAPAPARITVAALDVDATVDPVGVQEDGAMVIPAAPTSAGWYRFGSAPADPQGHTVIAGHVATREDGPGAFAPLVGAEVGMAVEVTDTEGTTHRYEVTGRENVNKRALPVDEIFARDGRPLLVLVTCGGEYVPELRSHEDNVVVTATPVP